MQTYYLLLSSYWNLHTSHPTLQHLPSPHHSILTACNNSSLLHLPSHTPSCLQIHTDISPIIQWIAWTVGDAWFRTTMQGNCLSSWQSQTIPRSADLWFKDHSHSLSLSLCETFAKSCPRCWSWIWTYLWGRDRERRLFLLLRNILRTYRNSKENLLFREVCALLEL
jgi:hypothetical protein